MDKTKTEIFIIKAVLIHGDKYDYSKVEYINAKTKICIICKIHGEFWQTPNKHLFGRGCNKCKGGVRLNPNEALERIKNIIGYHYDYSESVYINAQTPVKIICKEHGIFYKNPASVLKGSCKSGCQICRRKFKNTEEFIKACLRLKNQKIDYSKTCYISIRKKCKFICKEHGEFWQTPSNHLMGKNGCQECNTFISKPEIEVQEFVKFLGHKIITNSKKIISPYELDIYIPSLKKAIEFNGTYWHYHSDHFMPGKHARKSNLCKEKGIRLLHIREDLWIKNPEKIKEIILKFLTI